MAKGTQKAPRTAISLLLDADLLAEVDAIAAAEERPRVRQIAVLLRKAVADWHSAQGRDPLAKYLAPSTAREAKTRKGKVA